MTEVSEGDIVKDPQGKRYKIVNGEPVPVIGFDPKTNQDLTDYSQFFQNNERTLGQDLMGGLTSFLGGYHAGFADELAGLSGELQGDPTFRQGWNDTRTQFAEAYPAMNIGLEIGGVLANPLLRRFGSKTIAAHPVLGSGLVGGVTGGLFGAGNADPGERLGGAATGTAFGVPFGMLGGYGSQLLSQKILPAATEGIAKLKGMLTPGVNTAEQQVDDILRPFFQKGFQSFDDPIQAAQQQAKNLGPQGTLMDMSPEMAGVGSSAYEKQIGGFQSSAKRFFDARSRDGINRINNLIKRTFGPRADSANVLQSINDKSTKAGALFDTAKAQAVPDEKFAQFVSQLDDQIRMNDNTSFAGALNKLKRSLFIGKGKEMTPKLSVEQLHRSRMDLADDASDAFMSGRMEKWRMLKDLRNQFDEILPPEYTQAMRLSAQKRQIEAATDAGEKFFLPSSKTADVAEWAADATEQEKSAYMMGLINAAKEKMGNIQQGGKVSRLFNTPNIREKLGAIIGDAKVTDDFIKNIERENIFKATENLVSGNSFTAARQEANKLFDTYVTKAIENTPTSQNEIMRGITTRIIDAIKIDKGISPEVARALEQRLITKGVTPETIRMLMSTPAKTRIIQTLQNITPAVGALGAGAGGVTGYETADTLFP